MRYINLLTYLHTPNWLLAGVDDAGGSELLDGRDAEVHGGAVEKWGGMETERWWRQRRGVAAAAEHSWLAAFLQRSQRTSRTLSLLQGSASLRHRTFTAHR